MVNFNIQKINVIIFEYINHEFQIVIKGIKMLYNIANVIFFGKE